MSQDKKDVLNVVSEMTAAFHQQNIEGVMSKYAEDAVVVFEPESPIEGRRSIQEKFLESFAVKPMFEYAGHEVFVSGDTAIHIAPWKMSGVLPDGTALSDEGLSVSSLKKQSDGRWLFVIDDPHGSFLNKSAVRN